MAGIKYGESSPEVAKLQKLLAQKFGYSLKASGMMDEATAEAVNDLKSKIGIKNTSADVDAATLAAINTAALPRTKVVVNSKTAWVTKTQLATLKAAAGKRAGQAVQVYVNMANEAKLLWDAHDKTRKANWFWSKAVDTATGANFPSKTMMDGAVAAAKAMQAEARAGNLTPAGLNSKSAPIRSAFAAMDQYREETFGGGAELIKNLELIRDGCVVVLQVSAAIATGGASWKVQVGVSAGMAAYEQVLKEADAASKTKNYNIGKGVSKVFMAAAIDGTVGLLMKGGKLGPFLDDVADEAVKRAGSSALKKFAIKSVNGGAQQMIEDGIKGLSGLADPKKKFTYEDFIKAAAESFIKGAGLKVLGPVCEKYGKKAGKQFSAKDFKGLGKDIDLDKAGEAAVQAVIDKIGSAVVQKTLDSRKVKAPAKSFEADLRKAILADPAVRKAAKAASKKK